MSADVVEAMPSLPELAQLLSDMEPDLAPEDPLFEAGVALLDAGIAAASPPPWLSGGMLDRLCFKAHLGVAAGLFRVVEDEQ